MTEPRTALATFLAQLPTLTDAERGRIARARNDGRDPGNHAWNAALAVLAHTGREEDWRQACLVIGAAPLEDLVRHGAYDAALALLARDGLNDDAFRILYGQWSAGGERQRAFIG